MIDQIVTAHHRFQELREFQTLLSGQGNPLASWPSIAAGSAYGAHAEPETSPSARSRVSHLRSRVSRLSVRQLVLRPVAGGTHRETATETVRRGNWRRSRTREQERRPGRHQRPRNRRMVWWRGFQSRGALPHTGVPNAAAALGAPHPGSSLAGAPCPAPASAKASARLAEAPPARRRPLLPPQRARTARWGSRLAGAPCAPTAIRRLQREQNSRNAPV